MNHDDPFVSVIMPVRNEKEYIQRSLESVLNQDYPSDHIEILVADGMSDDGTRQIVKDTQQRSSNVHLIDNPGKIVPSGMNAALRQARGEVVIRVDGHCEIAPDYVRRCVELLGSRGIDGVGGPIQTCGETYLAEGIAAAMSHPFGVGDSAFRIENNPNKLVDSVPFPAYTQDIIQRAGPYDEELVRNQDDEYNYRLRKLGAQILLNGEVRSKYFSRGDLRSLWKQYFWYGFWKVRVLQKHPLQMRPRQFVPPVFIAVLEVLLFAGFWFPAAWVCLLGLLGFYLLLVLVVSIAVCDEIGWHFLPVLPSAFVILHYSYGIGFLLGFFRFALRWGDKPVHEW